MSYKKAIHILPEELLESIQEYVDGECIYIPRKSNNKKEWGSNTPTREELSIRNMQIYEDYQVGYDLQYLSEKYYLSLKSIQRIVLQEKRKDI
ncbi:hypothetical protein JY758_04130 [Clostridioides difficile]|uniref:CD3324 family protein n=1 Tax=Clostridioides difficile TaxID=1496 RepID=UPI001FAE47BC|nr:CD3324 family protein [Clostridioides difficile]MCJ0222769.1 hypothetical protein [Clostridioides difficile]MCJ0429547.1 hypothetical protein [Clostridioides difficile]MCJ0436776.1 hypothetical protein [Clostridioides difficile]MCU6147829.1 hypothetical protein [Clostridioides difficile]